MCGRLMRTGRTCTRRTGHTGRCAASQITPDQKRAYNRRSMHGLLVERWFAETWQQQNGLCYLCAEPLESDKAVIDHDHRCCPHNRSCEHCRRGLAHYSCNFLIGESGDNPERLRRIADNLERAQATFNEAHRTTIF